MAPRFDSSGGEFGLRHLPDTSNASFSFQIPTFVSKSDLLLGDDDADFLRNVNDSSMTSPGSSSKTTQMPLTLVELTPRANDNHHSGIGDPTSHVLDQESNPKSKIPQSIRKVGARGRLPSATKTDSTRTTNKKATRIRSGEASPAVSRLRALRTEVEMLDEDLRGGIDDVSSPHAAAAAVVVVDEARERHEGSKLPKAISKRKHTVISGGITKSRSKNIPLKSNFARGLTSAPQYHPPLQLPEPRRVTPEIAECEEPNPDDSMCSTTSGGVAARLVTYGQKFMDSFGLYTADNASPLPEIDPETTQELPAVPESTVVDSNTLNSHAYAPLTMSQLTPHQPESPSPPSPAVVTPASPMRPSNKRPASAASSSHLVSKKSKSTMVATSKNDTGPPISRGTIRKLASGISSSSSRSASNSQRAHATVTKKNEAQIRKPPASTTMAPQDTPNEALSKPALNRSCASRSCNSGGPTFLRHSRAKLNVLGKYSGARAAAEASCASSNLGDNGPRHDHTRDVNITKPVQFTFQLDTRMEARKTEYVNDRSLSRREERTQFVPVPDFKSLHAHQEVEIAHRKENIHPTVPLPFEFHTNERAKEREKFDQMIREKERDLERMMEQKRREREENEEREVRELRKKAVPKAHEVPEWYSEAPKKKNRA